MVPFQNKRSIESTRERKAHSISTRALKTHHRRSLSLSLSLSILAASRERERERLPRTYVEPTTTRGRFDRWERVRAIFKTKQEPARPIVWGGLLEKTSSPPVSLYPNLGNPRRRSLGRRRRLREALERGDGARDLFFGLAGLRGPAVVRLRRRLAQLAGGG